MQISLTPKKAGIYKLTNKINGKSYIGKSVNLYSRLLCHKHQKPRYCVDFAIQKYGWDKFDIELLYVYDTRPNGLELLALETAFIDHEQTLTSQGGYNICLFGNDLVGIKRSSETRQRMSLCKMGDKNPNYGKTIFHGPYLRGSKHLRADKTILTFQHRITKEIFTGNRQDFYQKYNFPPMVRVNMNSMIRGIQKSVKNWIVIPTIF